MSRAFPRDLAKIVADRWDHMVAGDYITPPRPPNRLFRELLETAYLSAGLPEEGRYPQFNVVAVPNSNSDSHRYLGEVWYFDEPRPLTVDEIRRLAPAVDFNKSGILARWDPKHWRIAGLVDFGTSWSRARLGLQYHYRFPECLFVQLDRPGRIKVYQGQYLVAALVDGQLERHKDFDFNLTLHNATHNGLRKLWREIKHPKLEEPRDYDSFVFIALWNTFAALANSISKAAHGGAIVISPKSQAISEKKLRIKYRQSSTILREAYVSFMNARNRTIDLIVESERGDRSKMEARALAELELAERHTHLVEATRFVAKLSGCDGAIIITDDLRLIGFGAEIRCELRPTSKVREVKDEMRKIYKSLDVEQFGQRHRSAIKLVSQAPDSTVLVISQDGPISVVWSDTKNVVTVRRGANFVNMNMPFA